MKDTASGITDVERALHVPKRRQGDRPGPGCARGRAGVGMTEFSAGPACNPTQLPLMRVAKRLPISCASCGTSRPANRGLMQPAEVAVLAVSDGSVLRLLVQNITQDN